jgi:hypothetical protein
METIEKLASDDGCECSCTNCSVGDCSNCTNADCDDENCDDCPMQAAGEQSQQSANHKGHQMKSNTKQASLETRLTTETFAMADDAHFAPQTLDKANRTVDVVWYGGATVPRMDPNTGDRYNLRLSMDGCSLARLNAGAPFFDNHMSGSDYASHSAGLPGSKAQLATVQKAWSDGPKGMATVKFCDEGQNENADQMFDGIASGKFKNLSFGTTIKAKKLESTDDVNGDTYVATDWEPYELSQANVPADYTTTFLTAETGFTAQAVAAAIKATAAAMTPAAVAVPLTPGEPLALSAAIAPGTVTVSLADLKEFFAPQNGDEKRALAPITKEPSMELNTTQAAVAGDQTRLAEIALAVEAGKKEERERGTSIRLMLAPFKFDAAFVDGHINSTATLAEVREATMIKLAAEADKHVTQVEQVITTRDGKETRLQCMEAALSKRANVNIFAKLPEAERIQQEQMAREYVGFSLLEMARESVELGGVKTRGMDKMKIATLALIAREGHTEVFGMGGAESTSDFPAILANVANKTLRQAYEAFPQSFKAFSKPATAADFKPINRVQLNDLPSLPLLNEKGEYKRVNLNDSNATYSLQTRGGIVAITRKAIINDDLSAFTRTSSSLGTAAARTQSDVVWGLITANGIMADGFAVFSTQHKNLNTGAGTSLDPTVNTAANATLFAMAIARKGLRLQIAPNGTPLNLVPKFVLNPAALETYALQIVFPLNLAASTVAGVVPEYMQGLTIITEPRLDTVSSTGWYAVADPSQIDTVEYCFLEGQEGVYYEMRQGYDVDGLEIKARIDFGAQIIDYRGLQFNRGT